MGEVGWNASCSFHSAIARLWDTSDKRIPHARQTSDKPTLLDVTCAFAKAPRGSSGQHRGVKWKKKHADTRAKLGLPHSSGMFDNGPLGGIAIDDKRSRDLLELAWQACKGCLPDYVRQHLMVDISQCGSRKPGAIGTLKSLTTSSEIFVFSQQRTLLPCELFNLMGWKDPCLDNLSAQACRNLIGESMSLPSVALMLLGLVTALPGFWEQQ
eukprot:1463322-Amphidinium_carterae.2